ncbi:hypothetical protein BD410DRAFT_844451 [Rickenella mellea]|uniref:FF domain-containing protein n=1 Tax=Rickenella mellea TaxID=50990 RepID=A0A4Y7PMZ4_9AGAM|nr:hypothetical protein BD410DRAFT_844451 [Rickenella mellea]
MTQDIVGLSIDDTTALNKSLHIISVLVLAPFHTLFLPTTIPSVQAKLPHPNMPYRFLGNSGLKITFATLKAAYDGGVNSSTPQRSMREAAETVLGKALKRFAWDREDVVISTKLYRGRHDDLNLGINVVGLSRKHVLGGMRKSLKRLQLDYVDLTLIDPTTYSNGGSRPSFQLPYQHGAGAILGYEIYALIRSTAHILTGTSEWSAEEIADAWRVADKHHLIGPLMEQPEYNLIKRDLVEIEYANLYAKHGLGLEEERKAAVKGGNKHACKRVDRLIEEAKALFKVYINPLFPWDSALPQFVSDPRYLLLPPMAARREAFNQYCRDRARELRAAKVASQKAENRFERRRKAWKKDRRFYGWGRDDREREKMFREWIKELVEQNRAAAQKAEAEFISLLKEKGGMKPDSVKRKLDNDPRYDLVGSSSLHEEIFNTYVKTLSAVSSSADPATAAASSSASKYSAEDSAETSRKDRAVLAVKEREEKIHDITTSDRSSNPSISRPYRTIAIQAHANSAWAICISYAIPGYHVRRSTVSSMLSSPPAMKLDLNSQDLEAEFEQWQQVRTQAARVSFDQMLGENAFVEFWGRLSKIGGEGVDGGVKMDEDDTEDGEGGGGKADLKALAKTVDIREMELVLKNDKRFKSFNHVPEKHERWLRDQLAHFGAPRLSVHIPDLADACVRF